MLRLVFKTAIIAFLCFAIGSYLVYLKTGRLFVPKLTKPEISLPSILDKPAYSDFSSIEAPKVETYKWRENGQWKYGDTPPKNVDAIRVDTQ